MDDKLVTIAEFGEEIEAEFVRSSLEENGIKAVILGGNIKGLLPTDGMLNVQVKVFEADLQRGREILAELEKDKETAEDLGDGV